MRAASRHLLSDLPRETYPVVLGLAAAIGFLAAMGSLYYATYATALQPFDVNGEITNGFNVPVLFSGGLLFAAAWSARGVWQRGELPRWAWLGIAGFFAFMGFDELATVHEHLESWTGVDWQLLYLPVVALGAIFWFKLLDPLSDPRLARLMWVGGVAAWLVAQVFEHFEFDSHGHAVAAGPGLILGEEIGEMIGSSLFLLALLVFSQQRRLRSAQRPAQQLA